MSNAFEDYLLEKGIAHELTMRLTPQQNGQAERKNRTLMEMDRCMLKSKRLPHKFWLEGLMWANHVLNCAPTKVLKIIMPFEAWHGKNPSVDYFCVFGCVSYAHVPKEFHHKLDDKAVKHIFVGYSTKSRGVTSYWVSFCRYTLG